MCFNYLKSFTANDNREGYDIIKTNHKSFLFELGDNIHIYVGEKVFSFGTNDKKVNYSSDLCFNDTKFTFAYSKQHIHLRLH